MAKGNGKDGRDILLRLLAENREMQSSIEKLGEQFGVSNKQIGSMSQQIALLGQQVALLGQEVESLQKGFAGIVKEQVKMADAAAKSTAIMEELLDHMGKQDARMDQFENRLDALESKK